MQTLGWGFPAQRFAWSAVELLGDVFEVGRLVHREVGALGEVLTQQSVGVLVAAALPGAGRVAEVDRDVGGHAERAVGGHLRPLVPGQRAPQVRAGWSWWPRA